MYIQTLDPIEMATLSANPDQVYSMALKDEKFWSRLESFPFKGDKVQIEEVQSVMAVFYKSYRESAQFQFGLGSFEVSPWSWLTYQFVHASLIHLLGNMLIVFLALSYLERFVESTWLALVYLVSGFAGGVFFLAVDSVGSMSVVGASASASGLLGFLLILKHSDLIPWFYMIAPIKGGFGRIHLPVFFIFPVFLVSDFVSLLWAPSGIASNVAVSAHVGGALAGMFLALVYNFFRSKAASHGVLGHNDRLHELT
jgi:membrane associated rhomboid family serine protease